jgi:plasmid stabilization system protein ParE
LAYVRLLGDARRSINSALRWSFEEYGNDAAIRYRALIRQAISDFAASPSAPTVRSIGSLRSRKILLRYDLALSQDRVPPDIGKVSRPRHFLVGRLEDDILRILFLAHDSMKPENVLRRSRRSDNRDH